MGHIFQTNNKAKVYIIASLHSNVTYYARQELIGTFIECLQMLWDYDVINPGVTRVSWPKKIEV